MNLTYVTSDQERVEVPDFLKQHIAGIAPLAVPMTSMDAAYTPLIPIVRDDQENVVAAALTCRGQLAAGAAQMGMGAKLYGSALNRHSELDLLAVAKDARQGLGTMLVEDMEQKFIERGVRVWFGNVTDDSNIDRLRKFYCERGFTALGDGQPLPPLLGREWVPPFAEHPVHFFYKLLRP